MTRLPSFIALLGLSALLAGCALWEDRAEFAAPENRWPANLPSPVAKNAAPPPLQPLYCYRTLAAVDCYTEAKPERITGYSGVYPDPDTLPPAKPPVAN
jgi:hypothetical protein